MDAELVKDHMKSPVQAIKSDKTIRQASSLMKQNGFGSLLVIKEGNLGMITERDLVHALAEYGENEGIQAHVSFPLIKIDENATINDAIKVMIEKNIRRLAVSGEGDRIVGIINMRDIIHLLKDNIVE